MNRYVFLLLLVLLAAAAASGQTRRPTASPTPPSADDDVVKITTSLIQVDVTVTDSRGRVITDLKRDEIEIFENGKKQTISNFSFVSNVREREEQGRPANAPLVPATPIKPEQVRRTVALVVDDLTLSFESVHFVRRALKKFVDEQMQDGDLVAIIRTGAGIGALQQFTSDKRMLYAAIERVKWNPTGSGGVGAFAPLEARPDGAGPPEDPEPGERTDEGREREFNDFRTNYFVTGTLGAVDYVVRGMSELPGRKAVMLFSDGFLLFNEDASGTIETSRILGALRRLIDQANRAAVVVYTLDARGLQTLGLGAADNTTGRTAQQVQEALNARSAEFRDKQDGLIFLARETGGFAIINNNDLAGGVRRVLDDQSYYLVAYEPEDETFDPKRTRYNRLDIKVSRPGARVRYRSGFFGVADETVASQNEKRGDIMYALTSPFATNEIAVRLNTIFGVQPDKTPFVRSLLHVDTGDITFEDAPEGKKVAKFDVVAIGFGDNGVPVDSLSRTYTLTLDQERYKAFMERGFVYDVAFPVKKPGGYQLRVAIKDGGTNRIGSASQYVDVPDLKKKRLTLSGIGLESVPFASWQKRAANNGQPIPGDSEPLLDTALRQFKRSSVLSYGLSIHNAKTGTALSATVTLYKDGKAVYSTPSRPIQYPAVNGVVPFLGSLSFPDKMELGEYVLRVDITDANVKGKYRTATQFIQFEIVE